MRRVNSTKPTVENVDSQAVVLGVRDVSKSYGGTRVLDSVSVEFRAHQVHALLGENGAGKSTLVKVMSGVVTHDDGEVYGSAHASRDVFMVFQELSVVPQMSLLDNLILASRDRHTPFVSYRRLRQRAQECLNAAGLRDVELGRPVEGLGLAQRQLLEIARGLMADARVLILDEPTATLSDVEIAKVHDVTRSLCAGGTSVIYITHRLGEVLELADQVTVMRDGRVVTSDHAARFDMPALISHMLGPEHRQASSGDRTPALHGTRVLEISGVSLRGGFAPLSLRVHAGEIVAIFGQIGSGAAEVARVIGGFEHRSGGEIELDSQPLRLGTRAIAHREGVAYISPDRVTEGVFLNASVSVNISSGALEQVTRHGVIRRSVELRLAREMAERVALDRGRVAEPVFAFSGGNQQKVAIARALSPDPTVLVLEEPTRGVDIGARAEIYRRLRVLAASGTIVLAYSSDVVEIRDLADRVLTMYRGEVVGSHRVADVEDADLMVEILHGSAA